ncbi:E3 ISG15--protein ligase HERC5-like [Hemicordylus capensis]|uniref:E3 ISG15--protein ligase HERC5-like n=1 Tax=Hemicordylus capensis TaxID=884348 RepID=UPI002302BFB2|nr:E3 ISG15--protein ligase HERC5-like [Hemicordylus capensis]
MPKQKKGRGREGKMPTRTSMVSQAPKQEEARSSQPPTSSAPQPKGSLLLLFPKDGYSPSLSEQKPGDIRQISCRQGYLAVVKKDRTVVIFDKAEDGGHRNQARNPKHIKLKRPAKVDLLDCQASHLLILSCEGKLSEHSMESRRDKSKPRLLKELGGRRIIQIACGDHHSMALSKGGELFTWGQNGHGQLGVGRNMSSIQEPQQVRVLEGIPLAKIAAGAAHSMALSLSGTVCSWGKNAYGQLGLGDTIDRDSPTYVTALEHKKTVFISCGGEHTVVLSKDGLVCTFGAGSCGQLGHNSTRNELFPRLVAELFGARVSQVACGRWHTLAYIPDLQEVYSFGSGAEGQLGKRGKCDRLIPLPLPLTKNGRTFSQKEMVNIIAGENQSIVHCLKEKNAYACLNRTLATVEEEKVEKWVSNPDSNCWQNIKQDIKLIFTSVGCVNGSFLDKRDEHFRTSQEAAGIDMSAVFLFSEKIASKPTVFTEVINAIKKLLPSLPASVASPEALRVFLIVPIILRKMDVFFDSPLEQLADAILKLQQKDRQILESLWSNLEIAFIKDLVNLYRKLSSIKLSYAIRDLKKYSARCFKDYIQPLSVLQSLYEVNCRAGYKIQENNFYVPEVKKLLILHNETFLRIRGNDFGAIMEQLFEGEIAQFILKITSLLQELAEFPCIFEMENKIEVYEICRTLLQVTKLDVLTTGRSRELHVRRQYLVHDAWSCIRSSTPDTFWYNLKVRFEGEPGIDAGGPSQEFFTILQRELCASETQIFTHFEESQLIWFSSQVPAQEDIYVLIGTLFGMALFNLKIVAFPFPLALFKKMANIQLTLEDLKELSPTEGRNLQVVLDEQYDDIIENYCLDFTIMKEKEGSPVCIELKENGVNIPVSRWNRKEYVNAYVNYIFNKSVEKQFGDFMRGFLKGCPMEKWKMFLPAELRVILHGHTKYDWEQLEKNAQYHGYEKSDETIKNFWAVFYDLPEEKKKDFLAFLTGTDHIRAQGMERFTFTIVDPRKENPDQWYPIAETCFRGLLLPRYTTRDILKEMFLTALEHYEKFGLS